METFKDIKGYECIYQVSDLGRVKSLDRIDSAGHRLKERILKAGKNSGGYLSVCLFKNGKGECINVHQLVAIAFLYHIPNGHTTELDHINGIKTDNRAENLQLLTNREHRTKTFKNKGTSEYTGVNWLKRDSKWRAQIVIEGKQHYLGVFTDELQASNMYQLSLRHLNEYKGNSKEFREFIVSL